MRGERSHTFFSRLEAKATPSPTDGATDESQTIFTCDVRLQFDVASFWLRVPPELLRQQRQPEHGAAVRLCDQDLCAALRPWTEPRPDGSMSDGAAERGSSHGT